MGRNLVKFKKKLMTSSLIRKYDVIIFILMLRLCFTELGLLLNSIGTNWEQAKNYSSKNFTVVNTENCVH